MKLLFQLLRDIKGISADFEEKFKKFSPLGIYFPKFFKLIWRKNSFAQIIKKILQFV